MNSPLNEFSEDSIFESLSRILKDSPQKYNYTFNKHSRKELINIANFYLLGQDVRLSSLVVIDDNTGGAPRDENQEKNVELIEYTEVRRGQLCGHVFRRGEGVYRCKTCAIDDTCVLCTRCFHATNHDGHDTSFSINSGTGGCCDCGDFEAWKSPLNCRYHANLDVLKAQGIEPIIQFSNSNGIPGYESDTVPQLLLNSIAGTIRAVLEFMLITFSTSPIPNNSKLDEKHILEDSRKVDLILGENKSQDLFAVVLWNDETHSFQDVIDAIQDALECNVNTARNMVKNVDSHGRDVIAISRSIKELLRIAAYMKRVSLNVSIRSARDVFREQLAASLLIWIRDLACFKFRALARVCNSNANICIRKEICKQLSSPWEELSKNYILRNIISSELAKDFDKSSAFDQNDNYDECVIEPGIDIQIAPESEIPSTTLSFGNIANPNSNFATPFPPIHRHNNVNQNNFLTQNRLNNERPNSNYNGHNFSNQNIQDSNLLLGNFKSTELAPLNSSLNIPSPAGVTKMSYIGKVVNSKSMEKLWNKPDRFRLDWFLIVDLQLWKEVRSGLRELYMATMMLSQEYKILMALSFGRNYPRLTKAFLIEDQGPEHSVLLFSVQLFTVPTLSVALVRDYGFLYTVLRILKKFFIKPTPKYLRQHGIILCNTESFRNRRYFHIFHDMRYLSSALSVPQWIASEKQVLNVYLGFISLFQGMSPNKRAISSHVEFEDDTWVHAFNVTLQVAKSCRQFADCYLDSPNELFLSIRGTLRKLIKRMDLLSEENMNYILKNNPYSKDPQYQALEDVEYLPLEIHEKSTLWGNTYKLVKYSVSQNPISFHHPLNWFLANLFRHVDLLDDSVISKSGFRDIRDLLFSFNRTDFDSGTHSTSYDNSLAEISLLRVVDYSIRVIVLMAQIRARMWVRNGIVVRSQAHHYREISLRENTYDQDIFLIQFILSIWPDSDNILMSMVDRFELNEYFQGQPFLIEGQLDPQNPRSIELAEEFLSLLIVLISDRNVASGKGSKELSRREIVHGCLSLTSYSELTKKIPERLAEHPLFDNLLLELTQYRAPTSVNDTGMYELKDQYLEEVDPYFIHYSRNQREEVEEILLSRFKKRAEKSGNLSDSKQIIFPKLISIESGPFKNLGYVLHTPFACQILFFSLYNSTSADLKLLHVSVIDEVLQLIIIALMDGSTGQVSKSLGYGLDECGGIWMHSIEQKYSFPHDSSLCLLSLIINTRNRTDTRVWFNKLDYIISMFRKGSKLVDSWIDNYNNSLRSRGLLIADPEPGNNTNEDEKRKKAAKDRQEQIMADFSRAQMQFLENFGDQMDDLSMDEEMDNYDDKEPISYESDSVDIKMENTEPHLESPIANNSSSINISTNDQNYKNASDNLNSQNYNSNSLDIPDQQKIPQETFKSELSSPSGVCIVCQEICDSSKPHGLLALMQSALTIRQAPLNSTEHVMEIIEQPFSLNTGESLQRINAYIGSDNSDENSGIKKLEIEKLEEKDYNDMEFKNTNDPSDISDLNYLYKNTTVSMGAFSGLSSFPAHYRERGIFSSTCGHLMHHKCFEQYCNEIKTKHQRQPTRNHSESLDRLEFLCPLCNSLGNFLLPILTDSTPNPTLEEFKEISSVLKSDLVDFNFLVSDLNSVFTNLQNYVDPNKDTAQGAFDSYSNVPSSSKGRNHLSSSYFKNNISSAPSTSTSPHIASDLRASGSGVRIQEARHLPELTSNFSNYNTNIPRSRDHVPLSVGSPFEILSQSPQRFTEGWNVIKQLMLGTSGSIDNEVDIHEWRMFIPIYLYLFSASHEWRSHVTRIQKSIKRDDHDSQYTNSQNYHAAPSNLPESIDNNMPGFSGNLSFPVIGSGLDTHPQLHMRNANLSAVNQPILGQINPNFQRQTGNVHRLEQNQNLQGHPENFSWSQLRSIGSVVSHATAGSPPWPGHSGVTVQNVFNGNPDILRNANENQNRYNSFGESIKRLTGFDLSTHVSNEQYLGQKVFLSQLNSYKSIYKQIFNVVQLIQKDNDIGLPVRKVFKHILRSKLSFAAANNDALLNNSTEFDPQLNNSKFLGVNTNIVSARDSSELSSNPDSVENDHLPFDNSISSLNNGQQSQQQTLMQSHLGRIPMLPDFSQPPTAPMNNFTNPLLNFNPGGSFLINNNNSPRRLFAEANNPTLSQPQLPSFEEIIIPSDDIDFRTSGDNRLPNALSLVVENDNDSVHNSIDDVSFNPPPNIFEHMISKVLAETIMCLEVSLRGQHTPVNLDQDDPRRNSPSGIWVDGISSTQLFFIYSLSKFAQRQYSLLLSYTTSVTQYCSSSSSDSYNSNYISKNSTIVTDAATSMAMYSVKFSVLSSLLKLIEPLRPSVSEYQKIPKIPFPSGINANKLPNRPFLMENPFILLTELTISVSPAFKLDIWQLVRLLFTVELVRVCIAAGDSVSGIYGGAPVKISSTLCPLSCSIDDKKHMSNSSYTAYYANIATSSDKNKWTEDPISHKSSMASKFDELYSAFKQIDPNMKESSEDIDILMCNIAAWTRSQVLPNSPDNNTKLQLNIILQSAPKFSIPLLIAHLLMPFFRRASGLLSIIFGLKLPTSTGSQKSDNTYQEFVDLWKFLRLPSPLKVFTLQNTQSPLTGMIKRWTAQLMEFRSAHQSPVSVGSGYTMAIPVEMPLPYYLTKIPSRFEVLFENSYKAHCLQCNAVPQDPSICLLCGRFVCSQTFCCLVNGVGECNNHMQICGGNTGLYLPVKKCGLLLLNNSIGCFMQAPYLDIHGEADLGLKRGRPLLLNSMRFEEIRRLAASHRVSITIARKIEQIFDIGGWETL
ncbi:E3 ubiquitin-protein ligase ubr1 [Smittium culicis]|uniref:E3 ubiquitin-protein ligase n=1 Tax=Smittium culicis TaxID=133412 RepID=A0A1R1YFT6_9FUNG|nr:E3 ubiquitin-protein ligase ubr1 [Smittium culicis]